ncbi:MAG: arginine deiminase-related protein [Cytophagales bacterium]|nr:arginine deiminase-related protein [Cytophagales bacterium]
MVNQISDTILMIRPVAFHKNEETAVNNYFQENTTKSDAFVQGHALKEFDQMVAALRKEGVNVIVVEDTALPETPDSIFPNNWISFHANGDIVLYPMFAPNRRKERRLDILERLRPDFEVNEVHHLTNWEAQSEFLEGTGSLILDRQNKVAYAALSDRTHQAVITAFEEKSGYKVVQFVANQSVDGRRLPIYHTNVMMAVGEQFSVICLDTIDNPGERKKVETSLQATGKEIIELTEAQIHQFAGNMLQVQNHNHEKFVVMSEAAFQCLDEEQKKRLSAHGQLIHSPIPTIEKLGGGSVRCMMAEVFLPHLAQA